jgi:hypothetical protein
VVKAPGADTNHWHCTREELLALEASAKVVGKRLAPAGLHGVFDPAVATYQVKQGNRVGGSYRLYAA